MHVLTRTEYFHAPKWNGEESNKTNIGPSRYVILVIVTIHGMIVHILVYKFQNNKKKYLNKNNILDGNKISTTI